jgi:hypothetical protein
LSNLSRQTQILILEILKSIPVVNPALGGIVFLDLEHN